MLADLHEVRKHMGSQDCRLPIHGRVFLIESGHPRQEVGPTNEFYQRTVSAWSSSEESAGESVVCDNANLLISWPFVRRVIETGAAPLATRHSSPDDPQRGLAWASERRRCGVCVA